MSATNGRNSLSYTGCKITIYKINNTKKEISHESRVPNFRMLTSNAFRTEYPE